MEVEGIAAGSTGNPMNLKEIFYTNLLLLEFDTEAQEAKYRIPFNSDMFLYPNKKAMEVVLHFLFCKLDAPLAFQEFRDCWPVRDKKMEQEFRKSCNSWLTKISKEEPDSNLPRIGPTLFLSPG
ncbi:HAUS augmin-like complex subunit 6, partial [Paramuricea clavata]